MTFREESEKGFCGLRGGRELVVILILWVLVNEQIGKCILCQVVYVILYIVLHHYSNQANFIGAVA